MDQRYPNAIIQARTAIITIKSIPLVSQICDKPKKGQATPTKVVWHEKAQYLVFALESGDIQVFRKDSKDETEAYYVGANVYKARDKIEKIGWNAAYNKIRQWEHYKIEAIKDAMHASSWLCTEPKEEYRSLLKEKISRLNDLICMRIESELWDSK